MEHCNNTRRNLNRKRSGHAVQRQHRRNRTVPSDKSKRGSSPGRKSPQTGRWAPGAWLQCHLEDCLPVSLSPVGAKLWLQKVQSGRKAQETSLPRVSAGLEITGQLSRHRSHVPISRSPGKLNVDASSSPGSLTGVQGANLSRRCQQDVACMTAQVLGHSRRARARSPNLCVRSARLTSPSLSVSRSATNELLQSVNQCRHSHRLEPTIKLKRHVLIPPRTDELSITALFG